MVITPPPTHTQNLEFKAQAVQKIEWKQTDEETGSTDCFTSPADAVGKEAADRCWQDGLRWRQLKPCWCRLTTDCHFDLASASAVAFQTSGMSNPSQLWSDVQPGLGW